jgi:tetratricopeptide (TPR) repeat protein
MELSLKNSSPNIKTTGTIENSPVKRIIYLLLILLITFIVYTPSKNAKFTNWDDDGYVTDNMDITSFKKHKLKLLTETYEANYHPLTMLSYAFDYSTGKLNPKIYHRTNMVLHLLNAALVFWLIILLTGNPEMALIVGILFGVHPLNVESVAWISERKNVLYTLFFLSSIISYIKYLKEGKVKFYLLALSLFIFSLLSKGMAVSLSITLIAIDYLYDRELLSKKILLEKIPFLVLSVVFGLTAVHAQPIGTAEIDPFRAAPLNNPLYEKILYATYNIGQYILKLFVPLKLAAFYPYPDKTNGVLPLQYYIVPFFIIAIMAGCLILFIKRKNNNSKFILFCSLFFLINIGLVLQLLPVGNAIMADRYVYVPCIGVFLLIALAYKYIIENKPRIRNLFAGALTVYCLWLSYLAYQRCEVWHNSISLWTDEIEKYPNLGFPYNERGLAKDQLGDLEGAIGDYKKCIELDPLFYKAFNNKGVMELVKGDYRTAISDFDKSLSISKGFALAWENRARAKSLSKDYKGAIEDYSFYLKLNPNNHKIYFTRGLMKYFLKDYPNAIADYTRAIDLAPENMEIYSNRGVARSIMKDYRGAILDFNRALELDPAYNPAYYNRAKVKLQIGLQSEACLDLQKAAEYGHAEAGKEFNQYCQ